MTSSSRPPSLILFIQNTSIATVSEYLTDAGLRVAQARIDEDILATVLKMGPDLIVLDFSENAETVERLKGDARTKSIPLIGLVDASGNPPYQTWLWGRTFGPSGGRRLFADRIFGAASELLVRPLLLSESL